MFTSTCYSWTSSYFHQGIWLFLSRKKTTKFRNQILRSTALSWRFLHRCYHDVIPFYQNAMTTKLLIYKLWHEIRIRLEVFLSISHLMEIFHAGKQGSKLENRSQFISFRKLLKGVSSTCARSDDKCTRQPLSVCKLLENVDAWFLKDSCRTQLEPDDFPGYRKFLQHWVHLDLLLWPLVFCFSVWSIIH